LKKAPALLCSLEGCFILAEGHLIQLHPAERCTDSCFYKPKHTSAQIRAESEPHEVSRYLHRAWRGDGQDRDTDVPMDHGMLAVFLNSLLKSKAVLEP